MKVLSLHQPWASLIALGVKTIETRSWSTQYRGPLAIQAAAQWQDQRRVGDWLTYYDGRRQWCTTNAYGFAGRPAGTHVALPLGAIVATCTLADVVPMVGWRRAENNVGREVCWDGVRWLHPTSDEAVRWVRAHPRRFALPDDRGMESQEGEGRVRLVESQRPYGLFVPGRYAWLLADVVPVDPPVPFKGGQGLTKTWNP